jgi:UbiD family decarboxylase
MAYADLRGFLATLHRNGQLLTYSEPVNPEPDMGAAARATSNLTDRGPALVFDTINGYEPGKARAALNVIGSWKPPASAPPHPTFPAALHEEARSFMRDSNSSDRPQHELHRRERP